MDRPLLFDQLARHGEVFRALFTALSPAEIQWRPAPESWCPLEVICHLHDEEREDFRARLRSTLETPEAPWPKIDPAGWVTERKYMEQDLHAVLAKFLQERERSLSWLRGLAHAPWDLQLRSPSWLVWGVALSMEYCSNRVRPCSGCATLPTSFLTKQGLFRKASFPLPTLLRRQAVLRNRC